MRSKMFSFALSYSCNVTLEWHRGFLQCMPDQEVWTWPQVHATRELPLSTNLQWHLLVTGQRYSCLQTARACLLPNTQVIFSYILALPHQDSLQCFCTAECRNLGSAWSDLFANHSPFHSSVLSWAIHSGVPCVGDPGPYDFSCLRLSQPGLYSMEHSWTTPRLPH